MIGIGMVGEVVGKNARVRCQQALRTEPLYLRSELIGVEVPRGRPLEAKGVVHSNQGEAMAAGPQGRPRLLRQRTGIGAVEQRTTAVLDHVEQGSQVLR